MDILVIRPDEQADEFLINLLSSQGWVVKTVDALAPIGALAAPSRRTIVILECDVADAVLVATCRHVRSELDGAPLIVIVPACDSSWVVAVLAAGADDVIAYPFDPMELMERVRALARRTHWQRQPSARDDLLVIDRPNRGVWVNGRRVSLTSLEFDLLCYLDDRRDSPATVAEITSHVHGTIHQDGGVVRQLIHKLRRKLGNEVSIVTRRGKGYSLVLSRRERSAPLH